MERRLAMELLIYGEDAVFPPAVAAEQHQNKSSRVSVRRTCTHFDHNSYSGRWRPQLGKGQWWCTSCGCPCDKVAWCELCWHYGCWECIGISASTAGGIIVCERCWLPEIDNRSELTQEPVGRGLRCEVRRLRSQLAACGAVTTYQGNRERTASEGGCRAATCDADGLMAHQWLDLGPQWRAPR